MQATMQAHIQRKPTKHLGRLSVHLSSCLIISRSVCLSVCLSVRPHREQKAAVVLIMTLS